MQFQSAKFCSTIFLHRQQKKESWGNHSLLFPDQETRLHGKNLIISLIDKTLSWSGKKWGWWWSNISIFMAFFGKRKLLNLGYFHYTKKQQKQLNIFALIGRACTFGLAVNCHWVIVRLFFVLSGKLKRLFIAVHWQCISKLKWMWILSVFKLQIPLKKGNQQKSLICLDTKKIIYLLQWCESSVFNMNYPNTLYQS